MSDRVVVSSRLVPPQRLTPRLPHPIQNAKLLGTSKTRVLEIGDIFQEPLSEARTRREPSFRVSAEVGSGEQ